MNRMTATIMTRKATLPKDAPMIIMVKLDGFDDVDVGEWRLVVSVGKIFGSGSISTPFVSMRENTFHNNSPYQLLRCPGEALRQNWVRGRAAGQGTFLRLWIFLTGSQIYKFSKFVSDRVDFW